MYEDFDGFVVVVLVSVLCDPSCAVRSTDWTVKRVTVICLAVD